MPKVPKIFKFLLKCKFSGSQVLEKALTHKPTGATQA